MKETSFRDTWAEVSLDAIQNNVKAFKQYINKNSKMMAVVKADGYGHGAAEVAKTAIAAGADYLGVALLDEALELRTAGITVPILILGYTKPAALEEAIKSDITLTIYSEDVITAIREAAERLQKTAKVHLKLDTGMGRIGISAKEKALELLQGARSEFIEVEGIFTHFAAADNPDATYTKKQFERFLEITSYLEANGYTIPLKHCCNSAATIAYPEMHLDMCRVGISIYGLYPIEFMREKIKLSQAMTLKTKPVLIKQVDKGQPISYGCTFKPDGQALIATLPVGYADGLSRQLSNRGEMTVHGKRVPIVGRICMDQTMIDVTQIGQVTEADEVTIFGEPSAGYISLDEVAALLDTIHYEIVCLVGKRVPRIYTN
ncbi:alanine racemase [Oceanobacillus sp. FSL H7-0719]|uniref:alanine racemase n=1 Tax=Oceanobacillus sp. FSL H7-0719 TaxID=2954507 RepID=UPI00324A4845